MLLANNQLVEIILSGLKSVDGDVLEDVTYSFSTIFTPMYSTPNKIRAIAGSYLQDIGDDTLLYLIHLFSVQADNLAICKKEEHSKWSYYASQWVSNNVALEAIINSELHIGTAGQKIYKKLGDFSISKDNSKGGTATKEIMDKIRCEILKLTVAVKYCKEPLPSCDKVVVDADFRNGYGSQIVVKGEALPQPSFGRMFFRSGHYPAMTGYIKILDRNRITNHQ